MAGLSISPRFPKIVMNPMTVVSGDSVDPGGETIVRIVPIEVTQDFQQDLLHRILSVFRGVAEVWPYEDVQLRVVFVPDRVPDFPACTGTHQSAHLYIVYAGIGNWLGGVTKKLTG